MPPTSPPPDPDTALTEAEQVIEEAAEDPQEGVHRIEQAEKDLVERARQDPRALPAIRPALERLDGALSEVRTAAREQAHAVEHEAARELSEILKGLPAEDAFTAHAALRKVLEATLAAEAARPTPAPGDLPDPFPGFKGKLKRHQEEGVRFMLARDLNCVLADDMGLGKTVQVVAAVLAADARAIVVGPANTLYNWKDEVEKFTGEEAVVYHRGKLTGPPEARFLLTTYDALQTLPKDEEGVKGRDVLVLDEAHYLRNPRTQRTRAVTRMPQRRRLLLTGTPVVNGIEDYHALLRQVDPQQWGTPKAFRARWIPEPGLYEKHVQVRDATAWLLDRAASDHVLRRLKTDVTDLPPRIVRVRHHELTSREEAQYTTLEARIEEAINDPENDTAAIEALHAMRQFLARARVRAVTERVQDLVERGESVVVFAEYLDPLRKLQKKLGETAVIIEGSTAPEDRQEAATSLGEENSHQVILAQIEAGGVGINLTAARHVLFLHLGWTPSAHAQAMDRVHRIGQDRTVIVEFYITPGTIDERMAAILLRKEAEHDLVLSEATDVHNRGDLVRALRASREVREEAKVAEAAAEARSGLPRRPSGSPQAPADSQGC